MDPHFTMVIRSRDPIAFHCIVKISLHDPNNTLVDHSNTLKVEASATELSYFPH